jgi:hypothetical protein
MHVVLTPHPATPSRAVRLLEVFVTRPRPDALLLRYRVTGNIAALRLPAAADPVRTDDLWRHTCFEAFLQPLAGVRYFEVNLSPSTQWATYAFTGYRAAMRNADELSAPGIVCDVVPDTLDLRAALDLRLADIGKTPWLLGLSAVIEEMDGAKSYWALAHPGERPDFHNQLGFTIELAPPDAT